MDQRFADTLKDKLDTDSFAKLEALANDRLHAFVAEAVKLCRPDTVRVCSDSPEDIAWTRQRAIDMGEESPLDIEGHTVHFDGYVDSTRHDQARDKEVTRYLVPEGVTLGRALNSIGRDEGLAEIREIMAGIMEGHEMYVRFFCLGPVNSPFSISCVQLTDSAYVAHSEDLLYRSGYEQFKRLGNSENFFRFVHSAGRLENHCSADIDRRRVYIDIVEDLIYSSNTQYGGNTIGLKKLALRLAIRRADREGWLAEHMFVVGVHGPEGRVTYFTGAYPSACGKTSTAMLPGETIVGDDLAYFRVIDGEVRTVNVEAGIFGIIQDVNGQDDPVIYDVLRSPGEVIFSNILVRDGKAHWIGMGSEMPEDGVNYSGPWQAGKTDALGKDIPPTHGNSRYTVALKALANLDSRADEPNGVPVGGIIYGGRDSDTSVPVQQSFDWTHGVITMGASLESETTAATIGAVGVRKFNPMSNLDFLAIPVGKYIRNNLEFPAAANRTPLVFSSNYWLKEDGEFLNAKLDKSVWVKWMELRVHDEAGALTGPTGLIPLYDDLKRLFTQCLNKDYTREDYVRQFTIRIPQNLAKLDRIEDVYREIPETPPVLFETLQAQRQRLLDVQALKGDRVSPLEL